MKVREGHSERKVGLVEDREKKTMERCVNRIFYTPD